MFGLCLRVTAVAMAAAAISSGAHAGTLTVSVTDIKSPAGLIRLCIFSEKSSKPDVYPDCLAGAPVKNAEIKVDSQMAAVTIENLPDGPYAVSLFHDENADGQITMKSMLGFSTPIPREGIGISNNPTLLGKPSFEEARFEIKGKTAIQIKMKYF